jgi:succinyl-CoA synthetase beta subunit
MKLHEYHAKRLFAEYDIAVPPAQLVETEQQIPAALLAVGGNEWIIKAQSLVGRARLDGGLRWVRGGDKAKTCIQNMLSYQHESGREAADAVLIERPLDVTQQLYLAIHIDPLMERICCMAAVTGKQSIEHVAREQPELIFTEVADVIFGLRPHHCRQMADNLGLTGHVAEQLSQVMLCAYRLFVEKELTLLEISPLAVCSDEQLVALNAKLVADANALFRQRDLRGFGELQRSTVTGFDAEGYVLTDVPLQGNIGCMVNGAGLAMATLDLIRLPGAEPACVMDIGARMSEQEVADAFTKMVKDERVDVLLINIFGGIVRCDEVAKGVILAMRENHSHKPLVVRMAGTRSEQAKTLFTETEFSIHFADGFKDAIEHVVMLSKEAAA